MTAAQRSLYFCHLWPAACERQGWQVRDEALRRHVTEAATGQISTTTLDEDGISRLFAHLRHLADPSDFDKAIADDPHAAAEANQCRQIVWLVGQTGLDEPYLTTLAAGKCKAHHCATWRALPLPDLRKFLATARRRARSLSRCKPSSNCPLDPAPVANSAEPDPF